MMTHLDIDQWPRKAHFNFFRQFDEPFFGVCVDVNCTGAYDFCQSSGQSFFLYYLHKASLAANQTEPFRYRIKEGRVVVYDLADLSATINRPDGTFGFSYMKHDDDFERFRRQAEKEIARVRNSRGLEPAVSGENVIHYSALPWLRFTSLSHARSFSFQDSAPKISFGKLFDEEGHKKMPVSVHVHHALMDGIHAGEFVEKFQKLLT